ncbi:hypothetical protein CBS101457_006606 [Exobasidium rhododendri]|nr:hypothetical protein CBS101457_006606 [Exobasidium rhododendri]
MADLSSKYDEGNEVQKTPERGLRSKSGSSRPLRNSFSLATLTSPYRRGLFANVASNMSPNRRPETPPSVARAMLGLHSTSKALHPRGAEASSSRSLLRGRSEREREELKKNSERNGVFSWTDSQEHGFWRTGNWGSCWLAESRVSSNDLSARRSMVAVKVVHRQGTPPSNARVKALWNEYKVLQACGKPVHPNIVQFREFVITPSYALVVMDYYQQAMNVALPVSTYAGATGYFQQLLSSLHWLHSRNVTHCDIKVANLLVDLREEPEKGRPVLVDFGFATLHDKKTNFMSKQSWGTPEYLSPERSQGVLHDERLSDIWALGVTFFEIATGRTPFEHEDEQFLSKEQLEIYYERTLRPKWVGSWSVPAALESLCRLMLAPNAKDRIFTTQALQHTFFSDSAENFEKTFNTDKCHTLLIDELEVKRVSKAGESASAATTATTSTTSTTAETVTARTPVKLASILPRTLSSPMRSTAPVKRRSSESEPLLSPILLARSTTPTPQGIPIAVRDTSEPERDDSTFLSDEMFAFGDSCKKLSFGTAATKKGDFLVPASDSLWLSSPESESSIAAKRCRNFEADTVTSDAQGSPEIRMCNEGRASSKQEEASERGISSHSTPLTVYGTAYSSHEVAGVRSQVSSIGPGKKPVVDLSSGTEKEREDDTKEMSYEIMAVKRDFMEAKKGDWQLCASSVDSRMKHIERDDVQGQMKSMKIRVESIQTELQESSRYRSPVQSKTSEMRTGRAQDLAAQLDEMARLAADLTRMVEETKLGLSRVNTSEEVRLSSQARIVREESSPDSARRTDSSTTRRDQTAPLDDSRTLTVPLQGMEPTSHPHLVQQEPGHGRSSKSKAHDQDHSASNEISACTNPCRSESSSFVDASNWMNLERCGRELTQTMAPSRAHHVSHLLARHDARKSKNEEVSNHKCNDEIDDFNPVIAAPPLDRNLQGSSLQLSNQDAGRRPIMADDTFANAAKTLPRRPSKHYPHKGGMMDIVQRYDDVAALGDTSSSIKRAHALSSSSVSPVIASRHSSKSRRQTRTEAVKSSSGIPFKEESSPSLKQQAELRMSVQTPPRARLSRMKSFTFRRPTSMIFQESSSHWQRGKGGTLAPFLSSPKSPAASSHVGEDPPRHYHHRHHHRKSNVVSSQLSSICKDLPAKPIGMLWNRLIRGKTSVFDAQQK